MHKQITNIAVKQIKNIDKLNSEIRKLEVMIVEPKSRQVSTTTWKINPVDPVELIDPRDF